MEDTKDLFAGIKIDRDVVDSLMASTGGKSNFYIVMGLDSLRNKKILIAAEPDSNTWKLDTLNHDFIWTLAYDAKGKQYLQSEFSGYDSPRFIAQNSTNAINKDLFNEFIKYALPVTSAMGATVCKCPTCCGSVQSSLLQPSGQ